MFREKHMLFVSLNLLRNSIGVSLLLCLKVVTSISLSNYCQYNNGHGITAPNLSRSRLNEQAEK
jgi:hypothetical protein